MSDQEIRDFDAERASTTGEPSGSFRLGGREWRVRNRREVSIGFGNIFTKDNKVQIAPFFRTALHPDDIDEFLAMIETPEGPLTKGNASEVIDHVTGILSDRDPTAPASGSETGSKPTGRKSGAGSSSRATRQRKSA